MTREERFKMNMIDEFKQMCKIVEKDGRIIVNKQSMLKALKQEPTTKNNLGVDCIARQDVERYIEGFINEYTPEEELEFINLELDGLKHLPPVTPQEPKTGYWNDTNDNAFVPFRVYKCSHCGATFCDYPKNIKKHKYCSDCGTKMVEPQESEG